MMPANAGFRVVGQGGWRQFLTLVFWSFLVVAGGSARQLFVASRM